MQTLLIVVLSLNSLLLVLLILAVAGVWKQEKKKIIRQLNDTVERQTKTAERLFAGAQNYFFIVEDE